ncbi:metallophosphoesterase [Neolewinella litorea]|uniref:metallophosphoesterase n=1 Tax=Neolewinella litorea TaxID=2562452 RepID=UPI001455E952|nr:metallophosphoesterase [Neolewinella litorea]
MALRIVQITDLHLLSPGEQLMGLDVEARFEAVLTAALKHHPDAFCFTGDFCADEPVRAVYERLRPRFDALDLPYYLTAGNHDDRRMIREVFDTPGRDDEPVYGPVRIKDRTLLFLDTSPGITDGGQLDWFEKAVRDHPEAPIFMHHPPIKMGVPFMDGKYPLRDTDRLVDILTADNARRRVFCGHYHTPRLVSQDQLDVFLCPPTSFFIQPCEGEFALADHEPGFFLLEWADGGDFRCVEYQVHLNGKAKKLRRR